MDFVLVALMLGVLLLVGLLGGWFGHVAFVKARNRGKTVLVGLDPVRGHALMKRVKPTVDGKLQWRRGSETGEVVMGEKTGWLLEDEDGQTVPLFILNRATLSTYGVEGEKLRIAPDDGWTLGMRALANVERRIADGGTGDFLTALARYTPIIALAILGIVALIWLSPHIPTGAAH